MRKILYVYIVLINVVLENQEKLAIIYKINEKP